MPFGLENKQMSYFNNASTFINTNYTQPTYFYIFFVRKLLNDKRICLTLIKNNIAVHNKEQLKSDITIYIKYSLKVR